ncbi:hypothetical protein PR202_ga01707 [Eleusine coracana subsp. coracana]|uniref:Translocon Sec61/SecY plug domain-containing protein n=1 Tax=Eleusine coracana subsp. coracana TaxID=191504 RepID=A0AAV5BJM3_ELECO|nr:hypothetical protein PR202_ga01020 [Eleusine coracana subsp. coracana]GJM85900.1 hypothetical protein PR202_ga01707 [Eleusine coracana subsp. coracana]
MATRSKFYTFLGLLPEVQCADEITPRHQKVVYTTIALLIFLAARQIPLYGVQLQPGTRPDPLYWGNLFSASKDNSLLTLGIIPILVPEIMKQMVVASKCMNVDCNSAEAHALLNRMQKLIGILTTIFGAVSYVLHSGAAGKLFGAGNAALVALQILFSGIVVIYLDDVLKKGYGLVSCISLLTATNICGNVLWKTLSPMYFTHHGKGTEYEGAVLAWVHLLITRTDMLPAMREAFYRQNLPNVINLLATCFFVPIAIFSQGLSIALPVRTPNLPGFQVNCLIKISNIAYGSIIFHQMLAANLYAITKRLYMNYGGNKLLNQLGTWKGSKQPIPDGGIAYYIAAPPTLSDLHRDPFHALMYVVFVLVTCALSAICWLRVCVSSKRFCDGFLVLQVWIKCNIDYVLLDQRKH